MVVFFLNQPIKPTDQTNQPSYRGITLTSIADNVYNALLLNTIKAEFEKIRRKNLYGFRKNQSATLHIFIIR